MATVRLSDAVVPEMFFNYMTKDTMQKMALYGAGVMRDDADLKNKLAGGGETFNVPFWKDLDDTESNLASDDPASYATPLKIGSGKDIARRQIRTQAWSSANLVSELAGSDPMKRISARTGDYWARQFDDYAIATAKGVVADNIANASSDMVSSIATDDAGAITAAELISAEAVMDAAQTMGDAKSQLKVISMHSVVTTRLSKLDLIDYRPDSTGSMMLPHYLGFRVVESDKQPLTVGTNRTTYSTYLWGADAMGWAESPVAKPVAVDPDELAADGMGVENLITRRQFACHMYGIKYTSTTEAGSFPTKAELALAANWDRVYAERKQIPFAVLQTNG